MLLTHPLHLPPLYDELISVDQILLNGKALTAKEIFLAIKLM